MAVNGVGISYSAQCLVVSCNGMMHYYDGVVWFLYCEG
jgi:hypothetical protein